MPDSAPGVDTTRGRGVLTCQKWAISKNPCSKKKNNTPYANPKSYVADRLVIVAASQDGTPFLKLPSVVAMCSSMVTGEYFGVPNLGRGATTASGATALNRMIDLREADRLATL